MDKFSKYEYDLLSYVIKKLDKQVWAEEDIRDIYKQIQKFNKKADINELDIMRKGEIFLGKYCEVDLSNIQDVRDLILQIVNNLESFRIPILVAILEALTKLALSEIDGKINYNNLKGGDSNGEM